MLGHQPARGEGEEEHSEEQNPGKQNLQGEGQAPRDGLLSQACVSVVLRSVVGAIGEVGVGDAFGIAGSAADVLHS